MFRCYLRGAKNAATAAELLNDPTSWNPKLQVQTRGNKEPVAVVGQAFEDLAEEFEDIKQQFEVHSPDRIVYSDR